MHGTKNLKKKTDQCFYAEVSWNRLKGGNRIARKLQYCVTDSRNELERLRIKVVSILMWSVSGVININIIAVTSPYETQLRVK